MSGAFVTALDPEPRLARAGQGPSVLLLHGWGASSELWRPVISCLRDACGLLAPDLPGFGGTAPPPAAWSRKDYARWLVSLCEREGIERAHLVGHSFGGSVAIKLATSWPERVDRLVLTGSAGIRARRGLGYHARVRTFKAARRLGRSRLLPAGLRGWAERRAAASGSADYRNASGTLRGSLVQVVNEDLRDDLRRIAAPTLLVWGERDPETPLAQAREMERLLADAGLVVFEGAGHYAYLEQASRFCRILRAFLLDDRGPGDGGR